MTKPFPRLLIAGLLAFSTVATPVMAQTLQPLDRIAAVVNEDVVLQSEMDRAVQNVLAQYANQPGQLPPRAVLERQVLERLVLVKLQVARATESGIRIGDAELNNAINAVAQQNGTTPDGLRQRLEADGMSFDEFRSSLRDEITIQRLRQSYAQSRVQVSEGEVDAAIAAQAATGVQYRLAHILVGVPDGASADQISTGKSKIDGVKALVDKGELDFSAAAVRYSDSPNALEGGDLGWRSVDEIPTAFVEMLKGMSPGQVVGPLRGPSGFSCLSWWKCAMPRRWRSARSPNTTRATSWCASPRPRMPPRPRPRSTPCAPASPVVPTSSKWRRNPPKTPTAATTAATWAGSRPTPSVRPSASRSAACRMARSAPRSAPTPAGTSSSASAVARPT